MLDSPSSENSTRLKEFLISLIGSAPFGVLALDLSGVCTVANSLAAGVLGRSVNELVENGVDELFAEVPELLRQLQESLISGRSDFDIPELRIGDRYFSVRSRLLLDGQLIVFDDITERVRSQLEQARLLGELSRANKDLAEFAYISAHDMKSPLASLTGLVRQMELDSAVKDEHRNLFEMIQRSVGSMHRTVTALNEVLTLKQSFDLPREELALDEVFEEVRGSIAHTISNAGAEVTQDFSRCPTLVMARVHLRSLLLNLVGNAIKYAHPDRSPVIRVSSDRDGRCGTLTVADNGSGIDTGRYREKIFGLFNRFHPGSEGAGIGLYMVRKIAQSYDGDVRLESEPGEGTTFVIEVPDG